MEATAAAAAVADVMTMVVVEKSAVTVAAPMVPLT